MVILNCQRCGGEFNAKRKDAMYCTSCQQLENRKHWTAYQTRTRKPCPTCGNLIHRRSKLCQSCENKSRNSKYTGENNPNWKGGRSMQSDGYVYILAKREGKKHRYQLEHIVVWEKANSKPLPKGWIIHHLNGIKDDNRIENLVAMPRKQHSGRLAFEPYQQRIKQLEALLDERKA